MADNDLPLTEIRTARLVLRRWRAEDRAPFASMNADPEVMEFFPMPMTREASDGFADRIEREFDVYGYGLYAVDVQEDFAGFVGLSPLPLTSDLEIGWRLARRFWGKGFATEAAIAVLEHAFTNLGISDVVSVTARSNLRSQRVMQRIGMTHDPADDFEHPNIPEGHPLRPHVMYRGSAGSWRPP
ncbi:MAG: GNAT family N-acetyltransferase [Acidimicrobiia bacterium]|nr:GNAT family N-acetyltransferase [Acidimicrobiia bacterium]